MRAHQTWIRRSQSLLGVLLAMLMGTACSEESPSVVSSDGLEAADQSGLPPDYVAQQVQWSDTGFGRALSWTPTMPDRLLVGTRHAQFDGKALCILYSFDLKQSDAPLRFVLELKARQSLSSSIAIAAAPAGVFPDVFVHIAGGVGASSENAILRGGKRVECAAPAVPAEGCHLRFFPVGDLDGDGRGEIAIAPTQNRGEPRSDPVRVASGLDGAELLTLPAPPGGACCQFVFASAGSGGGNGAMDASVYSLWTNAEHELSLRRNDRSGSLLNEVVVGRFATGDFQAVLVSETREHSTVAVGFVTADSRYRAHVLLVSVEDGRVDLLHEQSSGQMGGPVRIVDARGSPSIVVTLEGELHDELIRIDVATQRVVATTPLGRDEDGSGLIGQILCAVGDIDGDGTEDLALCNWKLGAPYRPGTRVQLRSGVDLALLRELGPPQDELDAVPAITPPARTDKK